MPVVGESRRTKVPQGRYFSEEIAPGAFFEKLHPGGMKGPNGEVGGDIPGGLTWSEYVLLGDSASDEFQMLIPDIRMPPNQLWPLHWHDCWTVVLILEGECTIGDWCMEKGDVFVTEPGIEYGPIVVGPKGCRLLEIFAKAHLAPGGYSPEYRDHPTLQGGDHVFSERSELNKRNNGRQILPMKGVAGTWCGRMAPGQVWDLGDASDPDRSVIRNTRLAAGEGIESYRASDWQMMLVLAGSIAVGGRVIERDGYLLVRPNARVPPIAAGLEGAEVLEMARTAVPAQQLLVATSTESAA